MNAIQKKMTGLDNLLIAADAKYPAQKVNIDKIRADLDDAYTQIASGNIGIFQAIAAAKDLEKAYDVFMKSLAPPVAADLEARIKGIETSVASVVKAIQSGAITVTTNAAPAAPAETVGPATK